MADARQRRIREELRKRLAAIDPAADPKFFYRPDHVLLVKRFDMKWLRSEKHAVTYMVCPGRTFHGSRTTGTVDKQVELFVMAAKQWSGKEDPYNPPEPDYGEIQDRLASDIELKVEEDRNLKVGSVALVNDIEVKEESRDDEIEGDFQWVTVEARLLATYIRHKGKRD